MFESGQVDSSEGATLTAMICATQILGYQVDCLTKQVEILKKVHIKRVNGIS